MNEAYWTRVTSLGALCCTPSPCVQGGMDWMGAATAANKKMDSRHRWGPALPSHVKEGARARAWPRAWAWAWARARASRQHAPAFPLVPADSSLQAPWPTPSQHVPPAPGCLNGGQAAATGGAGAAPTVDLFWPLHCTAFPDQYSMPLPTLVASGPTPLAASEQQASRRGN